MSTAPSTLCVTPYATRPSRRPFGCYSSANGRKIKERRNCTGLVKTIKYSRDG